MPQTQDPRRDAKEHVQISPQRYIELLRAGEKVADGIDLSNLAGRLCRGKDPRDFQMLGSPGRQTVFVLGSEGLRLFLDAAGSEEGGAPLQMLLKIGYDIVDIHDRIRAGFVFDLCVFERSDPVVSVQDATWDGVYNVLHEIYPDAAVAMLKHMEDLKLRGSGVNTAQGYRELQEEYGKEVGEEEFSFSKSKRRRPMSYAAFKAAAQDSSVSAGCIRKFLYDVVGLNDLYGGEGFTVCADGNKGLSEHLARNIDRSQITSLRSTAIGAPTLSACLERMSAMYEDLRWTLHLGHTHHLDRWLSPDEGRLVLEAETERDPEKAGKERVLLTPREFRDLVLSGETLDDATQVLDGICFRVVLGNHASAFRTLSRDHRVRTVHFGPPSQLQQLMVTLARSKQQTLDVLLAIGYSLVDIYNKTEEGHSFHLLLVRWRPWTAEFAAAPLPVKRQFPATREGVAAFCRAQGWPAVAEAIEAYGEAVCGRLEQTTEYDTWQGTVAGCWDMSYEEFLASAQGPGEVRQFVFQTLRLRGGWNGSGAERAFFGGRAVPAFIAANVDVAALHTDEVCVLPLGAPRTEDVVAKLKEELQDLTEKSVAALRRVDDQIVAPSAQ